MTETAVAFEKVKPVLAVAKRPSPTLTVADFMEKYASLEVHVFRSPTEVKICRGETLCSAETAIDSFVLSTNAVFDKS